MAKKSKAVELQPTREPIPCHFFSQCGRNASLRTARYSLGKVLWPLCHACDQRLHEEHAEKWCEEHGLHTREQKIAYVRAGIRKMLRGPSLTPIEHWQKVLAGNYPERSKEIAQEALSKLLPQREPGAD